MLAKKSRQGKRSFCRIEILKSARASLFFCVFEKESGISDQESVFVKNISNTSILNSESLILILHPHQVAQDVKFDRLVIARIAQLLDKRAVERADFFNEV